MAEIYQVFVRLLDGRHRILNFSSASISANSIKHALHEITTIPIHHQRLLSNGRILEDQTLISTDGSHFFPTVHLLLRLRGGKGGFGSLLRGAATKAGQKKTNNFDACRDMSGRRLRHVNAEKKMEEWQAEAEERRLEKIADEFIKKKVKAAMKKTGGGSGDAEKYVEKYRVDSVKCMEEVEKSVRESLGGSLKSKRKVPGADGSEGKRLKIWMGKRKLDDSDSDMDSDMDDNNDDYKEKENSVVINSWNNSDSSKDVDGSSGSVTNEKLDEEYKGGCSSGSGSEEDKGTVPPRNLESGGSPCEGSVNDVGDCTCVPALEVNEEMVVQNGGPSVVEKAAAIESDSFQADEPETSGSMFSGVEATISQPFISCSVTGDASEIVVTAEEVKANNEIESVMREETVNSSTKNIEIEKPLNFDEFSSAPEMEVLGLEKLKTALQAHGLKCGGTLQERAARLFLLKTTPVEMLPKKLLAKK